MRNCTWFAALLILLAIAPAALAHPFHLCSGEMEFNAKTGRWEVALKMHPSDLESAIRKRTGKKVDVTAKEGTPEVIDYLSKHFQLACAAPSSAPAKIEFVGAELERGWLWVYFELPAPQGSGPVSLTHAILLDDVEKQSNTVLVRNHGKRASLHFTSEKRAASSDLLSPASR